jgi:D-alanyl-D-alanine carboxypeptidase (penicillin-binding protein 5/6)
MKNMKISIKSVLIVLLVALVFVCVGQGLQSLQASAATEDKTIEKAKSAYLVDYETGTVLYQRNADAKLPIASMVKIMTLVLTFEHIEKGNLKYDQMITVSETAAGMGGSQMFLDANKDYSVSDLIKGIVVCSANDASVAIGETVSGSKEGFIADMNKKAKELGMNNTVFANVTGLPEPGQHSTARDVTIMMRELLKHDAFYKYSSIYMEDYKHPDGRVTELTNTNKLVRFYKGCDAGKTGFTNEAMFCLSASALRNDMRVVATVIGSPDSKTRFAEVTSLFNYAFANYRQERIVDATKAIENTIEVTRGKDVQLEIRPDQSIYALQKKGEKINLTVNVNLPKKLKAPVAQGDVVGDLTVTNEKGEVVATANIVAANSIDKQGFGDSLRNIMKKFFIKN